MQQIQIDCTNLENKKELFMQIKEKCNFPEYMGNNLDALADVLTERSDPMYLKFQNIEKCKISPEWMKRLEGMLCALAEQDDQLLVEFQHLSAKNSDSDE